MTDRPDAPSSEDLTTVATVVYTCLIVVGLVWIGMRESGRIFPVLMSAERIRRDLVIGLGCGLMLPLVSRALVHSVDLFQYVEEELCRWIGPLSATTSARLAILSGVGEELFFRGALQPHLGWVWTALLFGALHVGPDRRFLAWTVYAIASGLMLGWMADATGHLLAPMVIHITVNYLGFLWLKQRRERGVGEVLAGPELA